jgi:hypothetical protein
MLYEIQMDHACGSIWKDGPGSYTVTVDIVRREVECGSPGSAIYQKEIVEIFGIAQNWISRRESGNRSLLFAEFRLCW